MHSTVLCLAMVTLGVDVGWRPLPEGGMEYIIQIEPHMLPMLANGQDIFSDIPPNLRGARSCRITARTDELPREGEMQQEPTASPVPALLRYGEPSTSLLFPQSRYAEPAPMPGSTPGAEGPTGSSEASPSPMPAWETPQPLRPPTDTRRLPETGEKPALFLDQEKEAAPPSPPQPAKQEQPAASAGEQEPEKPWAPFTLALAGFFGSFGGMLYTGWLAWGYRRQYHSLLQRMIDAGHTPADWDETSEAEAGQVAGLPLGEEDEPSGL